jgi:hypothetical protein
MEKFFGGNPLIVFFKLIVVCVIVGIVLTALNIDPTVLLDNIPSLLNQIRGFFRLYGSDFISWFILGALIVIPVWFIIRLFKVMGGKSGS